MDEIEILAFRADETASKGITSAHLDAIVAAYDPDKQPSPVVIGHPETDSPAHGIVTKLRRDGSQLFATLKDLSPTVVEGVRKNQLIGRSIALWDPHHPSNPNKGEYAFRHFGLLGGDSPGIPNLGRMKFSADDTTIEAEGEPGEAVIFAMAPTPVKIITEQPAPVPAPGKEFSMTEDEIKAAAAENERVAAENKAEAERLAALQTQFAATQQATREAGNVASVDALIAAGKILPAEKDDLVKVFNALPAEVLEFSADEKVAPASKLLSFLTGALGSRTPVGQPQQSPTFSATPSGNAAKDEYDKAEAERNARMEAAYKN